MREADISDGSRVPHGSSKHVKDLEARIADLTMWRNKHKKGSEARANYARVIQRLKGELASARRQAEKRPKKGMHEAADDPQEELQRWERLWAGDTSDDHVKAIVAAFHRASADDLKRLRDRVMQRKAGGTLSTVVTNDFVLWMYHKREGELGLGEGRILESLGDGDQVHCGDCGWQGTWDYGQPGFGGDVCPACGGGKFPTSRDIELKVERLDT